MAKFNVTRKRSRAALAKQKRSIQGDPLSGKLKQKPQPISLSGKRKRQHLKRGIPTVERHAIRAQ